MTGKNRERNSANKNILNTYQLLALDKHTPYFLENLKKKSVDVHSRSNYEKMIIAASSILDSTLFGHVSVLSKSPSSLTSSFHLLFDVPIFLLPSHTFIFCECLHPRSLQHSSVNKSILPFPVFCLLTLRALDIPQAQIQCPFPASYVCATSDSESGKLSVFYTELKPREPKDKTSLIFLSSHVSDQQVQILVPATTFVIFLYSARVSFPD